MARKQVLLWIVALGLFCAAAGVAIYKVWPLLHPETVFVADLDSGCDLRQGPCQSVLPRNARVSFSIEPREIPLVKPLRLAVEIEGVAVESVEIDFAGVDMNMGYNRPKLDRNAEGGFSGEGILPVCVRDAMEWEARVLMATDDGLYAAPYRFITVKPGLELPNMGGE